MKFLTNYLKGKTITALGHKVTVLCSNRDNDVVVKIDGKYKCIKNGEYSI